MPTLNVHGTVNHGFDTDGFLDELNFDEDLSAFSPDSKTPTRSTKEEDADDDSDADADGDAGADTDADTALLARPPRWSDEEVSQTMSSNFAFWRMCQIHLTCILFSNDHF